MRKLNKLFIDQYGKQYYATSITTLKHEHAIPGKISKMFIDDAITKKSYHIGWVLGDYWFACYTPMREES